MALAEPVVPLDLLWALRDRRRLVARDYGFTDSDGRQVEPFAIDPHPGP